MISEPHVKKIFDQVMSYSTSDKTIAYLTGGKEALTRFAKNSIHQNVLTKDYFLKVVVEKDGKIGMSTSNIFNDDNIKNVVAKAESVAAHQTRKNKLYFNEKIEDYRRINLYDISVFEMTPEDRAICVKEICDVAAKENYETSGAYSVNDWLTAVASNNGFYGYHIETQANLTITVMDDNGNAGFAEEHGHRVSDINHLRAAEIAVDKVKKSQNRLKLNAGRYDVILEHSAVTSLLGFMIYLGLGAQSVIDGTSFLNDKIGQKLTGDNFTLIEDATYFGTDGRTFDYQGVPRKPVTLFEKGIAKGFVHDLKTAEKMGVESTGHGNPYPSLYGPMPFNTRLEAGNSSIKEMIKNTEYGIYITHFHYDNVVDPKVPILTGMTRDGTFLVEKGEIVGSIGNLRYNEKVLEAFSRIEALSADRKLFYEWGKMLVPAMKIKDFNFTGGTADA